MKERTIDLDAPVTQQAFGDLVGISQQAVSELVTRGVLGAADPLGKWLEAYCRRLREQAAGRDVDGNLAKERTALAREQRKGQAIKNRIAQGEWAPVGLLGDVLALGSAAIADRLDALPGQLRKACPELPAAARDTIGRTIASARNEWIRSTAELIDRELDAITEDDQVEDEIPAEGGDDEPLPV